VIYIEVEGEPQILLDAVSDSEAVRLEDWIASRRDLRALVDWAERLNGLRAA
jgi:hypothetical protein